MLKNPLAEIAGKEQAVGSPCPERGEKLQLGDADILSFVNHGKVERQVCAVRKLRGQPTEYPGVGNQSLRRQLRAHARKN